MPELGVSSPAMMDSSVLLPEPEAPTMATVSRAARVKSISRRMSRVPVESVTDFQTCSTAMMGSDMQFSVWDRRRVLLATLALAAAAPARAAAPVILVLGDSLSAEYGLKRGTGWVPLLEARLAQEKIPARVVNASISGETTAGGRSRLPALLAQHRPTHVVVELGGNDALRGLPLSMTEDNIASMARAGREAGARVVSVRTGIALSGAGGMLLNLIDDILDTGKTLSLVVDLIRRQDPASVKVCVLLDKRGRREVPFEERGRRTGQAHGDIGAQRILAKYGHAAGAGRIEPDDCPHQH